jgi:hypothetical protein
MEECAQTKAEGELLLAAWGDVPAEAVAGRVRRAHLLADAVLAEHAANSEHAYHHGRTRMEPSLMV